MKGIYVLNFWLIGRGKFVYFKDLYRVGSLWILNFFFWTGRGTFLIRIFFCRKKGTFRFFLNRKRDILVLIFVELQGRRFSFHFFFLKSKRPVFIVGFLLSWRVKLFISHELKEGIAYFFSSFIAFECRKFWFSTFSEF